MDDPIFDPWCLDAESRPKPASGPPRWRSTAASTDGPPRPPQPGPRPGASGPREAPSASEPHVWFIDEPLDPVSATEAEPETHPDAPVTVAETPAAAPAQSDIPDDADSEMKVDIDMLQHEVGLRLKDLHSRLLMHGHAALLDNRLDREEPSLRFRIEPKRGPFDDARANAAAVLEVALVDRAVVARFWYDPVAKEPSEVRTVRPERLTAGWAETVVLDFVQTALK